MDIFMKVKAVEAIKEWANGAYEEGGDVIVEAFTDFEILSDFVDGDPILSFGAPNPATSIADAVSRAQEFCGLRKEVGDDIRAA